MKLDDDNLVEEKILPDGRKVFYVDVSNMSHFEAINIIRRIQRKPPIKN